MKLSDFNKLNIDPRERVRIFIDGSNLYHGLKSECGTTKLDYLKFSEILANGRKLIRVNFYISTVDSKRDLTTAKQQQRFLSAEMATLWAFSRKSNELVSKSRMPLFLPAV